MKELYLIILLLALLFSCNTNENKTSLNNNDGTDATEKNQQSDSTSKIPGANSSTASISKPDSIIGIVYVKNKSGVALKELRKVESKDIFHLDFGVKLSVIHTEEDNGVIQKADSAWIKVKLRNGECGDIIGYVFKNETITSSEADFSLIPTDFTYENQLTTNENTGKLKFRFTKISPVEFNNYKSTYDRKMITDSTKNAPDKKYFTLRIADRTIKFHYNNTCEDWQNYLGYVKPLDSYGIEGCGNEACGTYLINKSTGKLLSLSSGQFIQGTSLPYVSKNETKFIVFTNGALSSDSGTYMILYKKDSKINAFNFAECDSFYTKEWEIEELVWVDEQTIAFKGAGTTGYLKGAIIK